MGSKRRPGRATWEGWAKYGEGKLNEAVNILLVSFSSYFHCLSVIGIRQRQQTANTQLPARFGLTLVNPRYFADASGKPVYLTGAYDWNLLL